MTCESQEKRILAALKEGKAITPWTALRWFGTLRLSARIYNLRKCHDIQMKLVKRGHARVALYRMCA